MARRISEELTAADLGTLQRLVIEAIRAESSYPAQHPSDMTTRHRQLAVIRTRLWMQRQRLRGIPYTVDLHADGHLAANPIEATEPLST